MKSIGTCAGFALGLAVCGCAFAQPFQIVSTVAPPSSVPQNQWRSVIRFSLTGSGSAATPMSSIPDGDVHDPVGVGFRTPTDLFIGNRHGNTLGMGSVSRFKLTNAGADADFVSNFTQPGMIGVHEIAFNPVTRELFCATVNDGIWRFMFDSAGLPVANGSFARGRGWRGVCIEPNGQYLYATAFSGTMYRFAFNPDNTVTELPAQGIPGASNMHFFSLGPAQGEIYVADINANGVHRLRVNADGSLTKLGFISSTDAIDCAFSPAGDEMFVSRHIVGGIDRFNYNAGTDTWVYSSTIATAESLGGFAAYVPAACPADLTGEGFVEDADFVIFANAYNILDCEDAAMPLGCPADFNLDGFVDDADFVIFAAAYDALVCS